MVWFDRNRNDSSFRHVLGRKVASGKEEASRNLL
jgi:hypothetical protein